MLGSQLTISAKPVGAGAMSLARPLRSGKGGFSNVLRNLAPEFLQYNSNGPALTPHDEESLKVRTIRRK
jgi:hypothetical protein